MGRGERGCEPSCRKNRTIERSQLALAICLEYACPAVSEVDVAAATPDVSFAHDMPSAFVSKFIRH